MKSRKLSNLLIILLLCLAGYSCKNTQGKDETSKQRVVLKVVLPEILRSISDNSQDTLFLKAIATATQACEADGGDMVDLFYKAWREGEEKDRLARVFATYELRDELRPYSSDEEVLQLIRKEAGSRC